MLCYTWIYIYIYIYIYISVYIYICIYSIYIVYVPQYPTMHEYLETHSDKFILSNSLCVLASVILKNNYFENG